ncbi:MAG: M20/M25/M40 family metallo-hydrolase [Qipengyuania sp.]
MLTAGAAQAQDGPGDAAERDLLKQAVEIPTVKGRGTMPQMTSLLSAELRKAGFGRIDIKQHDETETLIARLEAPGSPTKKPILLMAHMDVVEAKREDWKHDPFLFRHEGEFYMGRGVADNKASMVAMIAALQRLHAAGFEPDRDIVVLLTGDEETAQNGALLASTEWKELIDAEFALNSDGGGGGILPSGKVDYFGIQVAEKIYADYTFTTVNRGGHSSGPRDDNAIYQLAQALKNLEEYRFPPRLTEINRPIWAHTAENDGGIFGAMVKAWLDEPGNMEFADAVESVTPGHTRTRCIATTISGGHAPNALPQKANANVNCRIFPTETPEEIKTLLERIAGPEVSVSLIDGGIPSPPSPLREDVFGAQTRSIQQRWPRAKVVPDMSAGATDGLYMRAAGIPTYGVSGLWGYVNEPLGVHGLDERIRAEAFHDDVDHWERILRELAG